MSKLIRYCPSIRGDLIADLTPALPSLLSHAEAVQPLSDFFDLYANARERKQLVRGFYPKEVRIFDGEGGKSGELDMAETLEKMGEGQQRARVLEGVEKNVTGPYVSPRLPPARWSLGADQQVQCDAKDGIGTGNLPPASARVLAMLVPLSVA